MGFRDGLHNRVDIYPKQYKMELRTEKDQMINKEDDTKKGVRCRIIHDEKALFEPGVDLAIGDKIVDVDSGAQYKISTVRRVYGRRSLHHLSCDIERWSI